MGTMYLQFHNYRRHCATICVMQAPVLVEERLREVCEIVLAIWTSLGLTTGVTCGLLLDTFYLS